MKKIKFFLGVVGLVKAIMLLSLIIFLSIQKRSIPKVIIGLFAACSIGSICLLTSYKNDGKRCKKMREMDAFYDEDYESAFDEDGEDYFDFEEGVKLIPEVD